MIDEIGRRARAAARHLAVASTTEKNEALHAMADRLAKATDAVLDANQSDQAQARNQGITGALLDRLALTEDRVGGVVAGLRKVAGLPDPVGTITGGWVLPNGIEVKRVRAPLGVVAVIYEARPNVTADAGGLAFKAGNSAILRGSSYALQSNKAIAQALREGADDAGMPPDAIQLVEDTTREGAAALMQATEYVDLLVPRGGPGLISAMVETATVPYVIDGAGNCHVYIDAAADLDEAIAITVNSKVQRPGVCNAAESLLIHEGVAREYLPAIAAALIQEGVELRGDERAREIAEGMVPATEEDFFAEYLDLIMSVAVVDDVAGAVDHIRTYGSGHTEAIVSDDHRAIDTFVDGLDSAVVIVNAATRFTDGEVFGFGAEIGISTQKLHVRGPMGLEALTSERYVLYGRGHTR